MTFSIQMKELRDWWDRKIWSFFEDSNGNHGLINYIGGMFWVRINAKWPKNCQMIAKPAKS